MRKRSVFLVVCVLAFLLVAAPAAMAISITVSSVEPGIGDRGSTVHCTVYGSFIHPTGLLIYLPTFQLSGGTTISGATTGMTDAGDKAYVTFDLPADAPAGWYDLTAKQVAGLPSVTYAASLPVSFYVQQRPIISSLNPTNAVAGTGDLTLTVYGNYYFSSTLPFPRRSAVMFNGVSVPTDFSSATVLTAHVPASALTTPGTAQVTVFNPGLVLLDIPSGTSDQFPFTINAPTPTISSLDPASAVVGAAAFSLGVSGTNFVTGSSGSVVLWNGVELATTRDSGTHLTAAVPATLIASAGSATITVRNGSSGAPVSNSLSFSVGNVVPSVSSVSPTSVWAGYMRDDIVLQVNGANFLSGAHVMLGATEKADTAFAGATQLTVPLRLADIASPGTIMVGVKNPAPGGGTSATTQPLAVVPENTTPAVTIGGADSGWHNAPVALTFSASDLQSGVREVQYRCPPSVAAWTPGASYTVPVSTQGVIDVSAQASDWCGHMGSATATVKIDTTDPATDALNAVSVKRNKTAALKFRISEPADLSPSANVVLQVRAVKGGKIVKTKNLSGVPMNAQQTYSFTVTFKKGSYRWYVYATDLAGNTQANVDKASFTVK